jgi:ABC-2 type transport system ATP-binding protein
LTNAGVDILDVDSEEASLEDVFTAYTTDSDGVESETEDAAVVGEVPA